MKFRGHRMVFKNGQSLQTTDQHIGFRFKRCNVWAVCVYFACFRAANEIECFILNSQLAHINKKK